MSRILNDDLTTGYRFSAVRDYTPVMAVGQLPGRERSNHVAGPNQPGEQSFPMLTTATRFLELIRFSHTVFALPFALLAALLAWQTPGTAFHWQQLLGVVLCMVMARSSAMAFNRLVDAQFDAANPRTEKRHLPSGLLSFQSVTLFVLGTSLAFVASTLLFLPNRWPVILAVPVLFFLLSYSYAKRFTSLCHYWLATALMLSPLAAWIAIRGEIAATPVWLAAIIFFWVGGFDILYGCQDAAFDQKAGLFSLPAKLGIRGALKVAFASHLLAMGCLWAFVITGGHGPVMLAAVAIVSALLVFQHCLVSPDDLTRVNIAFFQINAVISIGLFLAALLDVGIKLWT